MNATTALRPIRVLLVDDDRASRYMIRAYLSSLPDIHVVGEASSGEAALSQIGTCAPDAVIMDIDMPGIGGLAATRQILDKRPSVQVVAFSGFPGESVEADALGAGASRYVAKGVYPSSLVDVLRSLVNDDRSVVR